jgi:hypothetical protein
MILIFVCVCVLGGGGGGGVYHFTTLGIVESSQGIKCNMRKDKKEFETIWGETLMFLRQTSKI